MIKEEDLQLCISAYKEDKIGDETILQVFRKMIELILTKDKFEYISRDEVMDNASSICLSKLNRYDKEKCKAWNYFTTVIVCFLHYTRHEQKRMKLQ